MVSTQKLKEELEATKKYLDIADVIIIVINRDEIVQFINKKGVNVIGRERKDIIGKNWFTNFIPKDVRAKTRKTFEMIMDGKLEGAEFFENEVLAKDGSERLISWHNTLLRDKDGKITSSVSSGIDITDKKSMESTLEDILSQLKHESGRAKRYMDVKEVIKRSTTSIWLISAEHYKKDLNNAIKSVASTYDEIIYLSVNRSCEKIINDFNEIGIDQNKFHFICTGKGNGHSGSRCHSLSEIDSVNMDISIGELIRKHPPKVFVLDSIGTLQSYFDNATIIKFLQGLLKKLEVSKCICILPVTSAGEAGDLISEVEMLVDEVVRF